MARGFGVAGALDHDIVKKLAPAAEAAGFTTFWANDTPSGDGLAALAVAAAQTNAIRLGVGVIPIDRKSARSIIDQVKQFALPEDRLTIGIGSGGLFIGSLKAVGDAASELKSELRARVLIGSLGPRMTALGGSDADGALLNWLTPSYAEISAQQVHAAASTAGRMDTHVAAYVRVALGKDSILALKAESDQYASYPQYARNFERMRVSAFDTTIHGETPDELSRGQSLFEEVVDEVVVRAIVGKEELGDYMELLSATAPAEN